MKRVIVIAGPTASGKTAAACLLSERLKAPILSADSRQIYKELNIGTAKPPTSLLQQYPHYFISSISIFEGIYNAGLYEKEALQLLTQIFREKDVAIVCGGTGLYIKALCEGLSKSLPDGDETLRLLLLEKANRYGTEYLLQEAIKKDPAFFYPSMPINKTRLIRYLEIMELTGKSLSEIFQQLPQQRPFTTLYFYLSPDRKILYERINQRVNQMIEEGLEEEAMTLYPHRHLKPLQTVGYREWWPFFEGNMSRAQVIENIKTATRRYAKRQYTWFNHQSQYIKIDPHTPEQVVRIIEQHLSL